MVAAHEIMLRGLSLVDSSDERPLILERTESDFVTSVLDDLESDSRVQALTESRASQQDRKTGRLKLFQPVHKTWHIALFEAFCDTIGNPRLDPKQIDGAGLVVRREPLPGEQMQAWLSAGRRQRGWIPLRTQEQELDPDPKKRKAASSGHPEIDRLLTLRRSLEDEPAPAGEDVAPLFTAPPEVCEAAGRTILYALVPLASSEQGADSLAPPDFPAADVERHLSVLLKTRSQKTVRNQRFNWLGGNYTREEFDQLEDTDVLTSCLRQLHVELDAFGESSASRQLFNAVNRTSLMMGAREARPAGEFFRDAVDTLLLDKGGRIRMPSLWLPTDPGVRAATISSAQAVMSQQFASLNAGEGRFDPQGRSYHIRGFVRVKRHDCCEPQIAWSMPSESFVISEWFDGNGNVPPVQLTLPDPMEDGFLESLKPNVSFQMSEGMFNLLDQLGIDQISDLLAGKDPGLQTDGNDSGFGLGWICSFNISIVFMIAFILMFMFLFILNIVFFWMFFIKICIPYPKPE